MNHTEALAEIRRLTEECRRGMFEVANLRAENERLDTAILNELRGARDGQRTPIT